jgi:hypothetical protein
MEKWTIAAAAAAVVVVLSGAASAHEFACEKTIDGSVVRIVDRYPSTLLFRIVLTNTHPNDTSIALSFRDELLQSLGVTFHSTPLAVDVGQSVELTASVTVTSEAQCLKLAGARACTAQSTDAFQVIFDGGVAQCSARLVCMPDDSIGGAAGREN